MCHGVGQDGCMMNLTKASNVLCALFVVHGMLGNKEHPRKWLGSYPRTPTP